MAAAPRISSGAMTLVTSKSTFSALDDFDRVFTGEAGATTYLAGLETLEAAAFFLDPFLRDII